MTIKRLEKVYEGKAKILYATEDPSLMIQYFKESGKSVGSSKEDDEEDIDGDYFEQEGAELITSHDR